VVRLERLPDRNTIHAFRGVVDFCVWRGQPYARMWPRRSLQPRQPGEVRSSDLFRVVVKMTVGLPPQVLDVYKARLPSGVSETWVDVQRATARGPGRYDLAYPL